MEEKILKKFEYFEDFPDKFLLVNNDELYYLLRIDEKNYVVQSHTIFLSIDSKKNISVTIKEFHNVLDGKLMFRGKFISRTCDEKEKLIESKLKVKVNLLSDILNIYNNESCYLSKNDVEVLNNYKFQEEKKYKKVKNYY